MAAALAKLATEYYSMEEYPCEGSLKPASHFNAEEDCEKLRKACKGLGTDEDAVISVMAGRSVTQRLEIISKYKTMFGKDLQAELKSELSGKLRKVCDALCMSPAEYDAHYLREAMAGAGTKEAPLIHVLCTRTNQQIIRIKEAYKLHFKKSLEEDIESETSGYFRRILIAILQAGRDESHSVDKSQAESDAKKLFEAGENTAGTDEVRFIAVLASRSPAQLREVMKAYTRLRDGKTLDDAISSEFSGDIREALLTILRSVDNKPAYFACLLHSTMKGAGTKDDQLIHTIVSRCEVDMKQIKREFIRIFQQPLLKWVAEDTSGDYRKALIALLGGPNAQDD